MATTIRPELDPGNKYWIEKHRYYELKHFCLQYPIWRKKYEVLSTDLGIASIKYLDVIPCRTDKSTDWTTEKALELVTYRDKMELLERVAKETDLEIGNYILQGVTRGVSYDSLNAKEELPCSKDTYYDLYRKFFWLLNKERN